MKHGTTSGRTRWCEAARCKQARPEPACNTEAGRHEHSKRCTCVCVERARASKMMTVGAGTTGRMSERKRVGARGERGRASEQERAREE
eukprot:1685715-Rhodomonas_salina.1